MIKIVPFEASHATHIFELREGRNYHPSAYKGRLILGYISPGSVARTLMHENNPIACGGIINLDWQRGEAWVLESPAAKRYPIAIWKSFIGMIPYLAEAGGFRRVQACCYDLTREKFFRLLGFERETKDDMPLRCFGPNGEDAALYSRIFL